jgi:LssY C-terminus
MRRVTGRISSHLRLVSLLAIVGGLLLAGILLIRVYPYPVNFGTLPRLTQTATGIPGDPINLILIGSTEQITQSFERAGWLIPDPITPQTTTKIAVDSLAHRSYPTAPVSNLYVLGHAQDLAFEKPTTDVQNRGHVRLWKTTTHISGELVWVGQASYDQGIELSGSTHFPTHHILPTVDLERGRVGADLLATGLVRGEAVVTYTAPIFAARNGGGDYYESDGDVLVVNLTQVPLRLFQPPLVIGGLKTGAFLIYDALLTVVTSGGALVALLIIVAIGFALVAGTLLWRRSGRQRVAKRQRSSPAT